MLSYVPHKGGTAGRVDMQGVRFMPLEREWSSGRGGGWRGGGEGGLKRGVSRITYEFDLDFVSRSLVSDGSSVEWLLLFF